LLNGNEIGILVQVNSGLPLNVSAVGDLNGDGISSDRPNNVPRGALYLPARKNVDLRYTRWIPLGKSTRAEIIAELKNVFNTEQMSASPRRPSSIRSATDDADSDRPVPVRQPVRLRTAQVPVGFQSSVLGQ